MSLSNYTCHKCNQTFKSKWHLTRHLNKKKPCISITNNSSYVKKVNQKVKINNQPTINKEKKRGKKLLEDLLINNILENDNNISSNNNDNQINITIGTKQQQYVCEYCNQVFKHRSSLCKHKTNLRCYKIPKQEIKKVITKCKNKKIVQIKKRIEQNNNIDSIEENENFTDNSTNVTNMNIMNNSNNTNNITNNNTNNITNNIVINLNPFGKEDLSSITKEQKINTLNQMFLALPKALETIHYNILENNNFFLANKNNKKFITYFDGESFIYEHSNKFKDKLCTNLMEHLEEWFNEYKNQLLKNKKSMLKKVFNQYYDGKLDDKYSNEIDKYLLSYSDEIKGILNETIKKVRKEKRLQNLQKLQEQLTELNVSDEN